MREGEGQGRPGSPARAPGSALRSELTIDEAACYLGLPEAAVSALVAGGFLQAVGRDASGPVLSTAELRAFMVWNMEDEVDVIDLSAGGDPDRRQPDALLRALDGRSDEMARQAYEIFADVFPEARTWSPPQRARFVDQAKSRVEAILAVSRLGFDLDEALAADLQGVGAAAAWDGAPLPQLLVVLRISRDLVVQTAVELAEDGGRHWGLALSSLLSQVLPATDRLTDSLAKGYWSAVVSRQKEARARFEHVVEHASDGVYEVDLEGRIQYCNPQFGLILGRRRLDELIGSSLSEVMAPRSGSATGDLSRPSGGAEHVRISVTRPDGVRRVLEVRTVSRLENGELVGHQGVVRDVTAAHDLGAEKDRLVGSLLDDLRLALVRLADLGAGLESEGGRLGPDRLRHVATSVVGNVEHLSDLTERVTRANRTAAELPLLTPRPLELSHAVHAALAGTRAETLHAEVQVPSGLTVMADSEGLQRVLRDIVERALRLGAVRGGGAVRVEVEGVRAGEVHLAVSHPRPATQLGDPAPAEDEPALVRALVEAMGGRVRHETEPERERFHLTVPMANRRKGDEAIRL